MCETLESLGFVDIQSLEILQIEDIVKTKSVPVLDLDFVKHKVRVTQIELMFLVRSQLRISGQI